jgi:SAM-dependent methyltransferase
MAEDGYLLGSSRTELQRLAFQHRAWAQETASLWRRAGFGPGQTLLDLGCGPGFASLDLAHLVGPAGKVVAFDGSPSFLEDLRRQTELHGLDSVELRQGDVHSLDLPDASVDGVYARWLFCFVHDPEAVAREVVRVLRPGGRLAVTDYFNYRAFTMAPRSPAFDRVVEAVQRYWRRQGGDLEIQGRLPALLEAAGLAVEDVVCNARAVRPGSPLWEWPQEFFRTFLPTLVEAGEVSREEAGAFEAVWEERARQPGAYLCLPPILDAVAVKE